MARGRALVCGDCWHSIRPTEYEPNTFNLGECVLCSATMVAVHRVSWAEVDNYEKALAKRLEATRVRQS